jgi:hypothetical protein
MASCEKKTLSFSLPERDKKEIQRRAAAKGVTVSEYVRGHFYDANDPAETICDATMREDGDQVPYVERRKLGAAEARRLRQLEDNKTKIRGQKGKADKQLQEAQAQKDNALKAADNAAERQRKARTKTQLVQAQKDQDKALAHASRMDQIIDDAQAKVQAAKEQVVSVVQEQNQILQGAGHEPMPVPPDCSDCVARGCGGACTCSSCNKAPRSPDRKGASPGSVGSPKPASPKPSAPKPPSNKPPAAKPAAPKPSGKVIQMAGHKPPGVAATEKPPTLSEQDEDKAIAQDIEAGVGNALDKIAAKYGLKAAQ